MDKDLLEILKLVAEDMTLTITAELQSRSGVDSGVKLHENGSFLKNTYFEVTSKGTFKLVIPKYVVKRRASKKIRAEYLVAWIKRKGITPRKGMTVNQLAFAISNTIYKRGLSSSIFNDWILSTKAVEEASEQLAGYLSQKILDDLVKAFVIK